MKEKKTVFKLFFVWDFEKEERWLNEMAQEGWVLDNTGFSFYTFGALLSVLRNPRPERTLPPQIPWCHSSSVR